MYVINVTKKTKMKKQIKQHSFQIRFVYPKPTNQPTTQQ